MPQKVLTAALAVCLFLLILGAKWAVFDRFGSPMPDWDQWDAEGAELFIPWFDRDHFLSHLFHPHNEHRVILTKLQNLALGLMNGQWDSRLEAVANAHLHAALAVAFWLFGRRWIRHRAETAPSGTPATPQTWARTSTLLSGGLFIVIAALFGLPVAWQNILGGFHSQQYWLLGLSFTAIVTLPFARTGSAPWWFGVTAVILALGSMASGFVAAAVVLVVIAWRIFRGAAGWRELWPAVTITMAVVAFGWFTRVEFPGHRELKAANAHDFFFSIVHSLQWPWRERAWAVIVMWLPWALVVMRIWPRREAGTTSGITIAALGGWVLVQVIATAYARGARGDYPASRYMDTLAFGAAVNAVAIAWLLAARTPTRWHLAGLGLLAAGWLATLGLGLRPLLEINLWYELPDVKRYYAKTETNVRRYLATNDRQHLPYPDIPFPDADLLIHRLSHPHLRAMMPLPVRAPLPLSAGADPTSSVFAENDSRAPATETSPRPGLSPQTPPLDTTKTWGSFGANPGATAQPDTSWKSAPVTATLRGWLKFELAGQLESSSESLSLELRDARTDALLATVKPQPPPRDAWQPAYVRTPRQPFIVVAHDRDATRWFAFSAPVEMGALSYWAACATWHGWRVFQVSAAASVLLGGLAWWMARLSPARVEGTHPK